jgi:hypothetical protein
MLTSGQGSIVLLWADAELQREVKRVERRYPRPAAEPLRGDGLARAPARTSP